MGEGVHPTSAKRTTSRITCDIALGEFSAAVLARVDRFLIGGHASAEEYILAHAAIGAERILELGDPRALGALGGGGAADDPGVGLVGPAPGSSLHQLVSRVGGTAVRGDFGIPVAAKVAKAGTLGRIASTRLAILANPRVGRLDNGVATGVRARGLAVANLCHQAGFLCLLDQDVATELGQTGLQCDLDWWSWR